MITNTLNGDLIEMIRNSKKSNTENTLMLVQGCNCFISQGAGIAGQLREFPEVLNADINYGRGGDVNKLGEMSIAPIPATNPKSLIIVFNMYTQYHGGPNAEYSAIKTSFENLNSLLKGKQRTVYVPEIGCGIGGLDLNLVRDIINKATPDVNIVLMKYTQGIDPRGLK